MKTYIYQFILVLLFSILPCKKIKNPDKFAKYYDEPSEFTFDQILNPNKEREIISSTPKNKFYSLNFNSNIYH